MHHQCLIYGLTVWDKEGPIFATILNRGVHKKHKEAKCKAHFQGTSSDGRVHA